MTDKKLLVCYPNETTAFIRYQSYINDNISYLETLALSVFVHLWLTFMFLSCLANIGPKHTKGCNEKNGESDCIDVQVVTEVKVIRKLYYRSKSHMNMIFSPSKDVSLLDLDDIQKIRYIENRESQEDEKDYNAGGYMPVNIGDILKGQYKVCRKLGWGHFSTVWLCKNLLDDGIPTYVALKICKSAQMFAVVAQDEIKLLRETKSMDPTHIGYKHIVQMVDTFKLISVNGIHTAISMEIMGPSLLHLLIQSDFRGIHLNGVRRIISQVLKGLIYLHDVCHIIHTDIKPENILIKVDENYIKSIIGKTERFAELGLDMPRSYVASDCWVDKDRDDDLDRDILSKYEEQRGQSYPYDKFLGELTDFRRRHAEPRLNAPMWVSPNIEIKIADLGNACWEDHHFSSEIQTRQYRALEVILGAGYSYPADIWSVGCMTFELATGEMLFSPKGDKEPSANLDHLCLIWETLGGIPQYITERGTNARQYFANGNSNQNINYYYRKKLFRRNMSRSYKAPLQRTSRRRVQKEI
ncbi:unnamed protein product [Acanthoscelides obtectus]|uniref:non-specific serine/threonine protein kinase n=1 Tax=Acanthoscelides obtectus TaxID=200917 RepID=A0A9P0M2W3_ACAOB|nr:unnamed protein product [Acanthoscelides obtectus]CAK1629267.1 Protein kinase dsk1 [Acanthoscelides obtectus]